MKRRGDKTHLCWSPTPTWNGFDCSPLTQTQTSGRHYYDLMARTNLPTTSYSLKTFQSLSRGTRSYAFSRSTKHAKIFLPYSQDFLKICFQVKIWSVVLRPGRKPHWPFSSFDSTISRHFLSRYLFGLYFSWQTEEWYFCVVCTLLAISFLEYRNNHTCLPISGNFAKLLRHLTHSR